VPPVEPAAGDAALARRWIGLAVAAFALAVAILVGVGQALNFDEAVYAVGGRAWWTGAPDTGWDVYRSIGMRLVAVPGVALGGGDGGGEIALRVVPALLALATFAVIAHAGRRWVGGAATALALATLIAVPYWLRHSAELLSDVPSLGLCVGVLAIVTCELGRADGPRWRLVAAAPLAAAAFYVRYGSAQVLGAIAVVAVVVYARAIVRRPGPVIAAAGLAVALVVPHVVMAIDATGSPLGIVRASAAATTQAYVGDGLVFYLQHWFYDLYSGPAAVVTAIGVVAGARRAVRRELRADPIGRTLVVLWAVALVHLVWVGLSAHGERRYVFPALVLFALVGSQAIVAWWGARDGKRPPWLRHVAIAVLAGAAVYSTVRAVGVVRRSGAYFTVITEVAARIREDAGGAPCAVLASPVPQLTWYSGCSVAVVGEEPAAALARLPGGRRYVVLFATAPLREPSAATKDRIRAALADQLLARIADRTWRANHAEVYRADRAVRADSLAPDDLSSDPR
jgi:hypothetical protein